MGDRTFLQIVPIAFKYWREILVTPSEMKRSHFMTKPLINMTFMNLINDFNELTLTEIY